MVFIVRLMTRVGYESFRLGWSYFCALNCTAIRPLFVLVESNSVRSLAKEHMWTCKIVRCRNSCVQSTVNFRFIIL